MSNFNQAKLALLQESYQRKFERIRAVQAQYDLETCVEEKLRMRHVLNEDWQELAAIEQQI